MKSRGSIRASVIVSVVFVVMFAVFLLILACILPRLVDSLLNAPDLIGDRTHITPAVHTLILALAYAMIAVALATTVLLVLLLHCVYREQVFTNKAVRLISAIALCCVGEGVLFFAMGYWFQLSFLVFAAMFFLGLCLHIVGTVIAEAIRYKDENELTV